MQANLSVERVFQNNLKLYQINVMLYKSLTRNSTKVVTLNMMKGSIKTVHTPLFADIYKKLFYIITVHMFIKASYKNNNNFIV